MPPVIAILPAILINLAIAAVFTIVSRLLAPHQAQKSAVGGQLAAASDPGVELTLRAAGEPHQIVFGRRRVKGNIVFAHCTNNNQRLNLAIEWTGHQSSAVGGLYFDDELVPIVDGVATGKYAGLVRCYDNLGTDDQEIPPEMLTYCSDIIDAHFRGRGVTWSFVQLNWDRSKFPQGLPNIWRVIDGMPVYDPRDESTGWSENAILCAAAWMNNRRYGRSIPYGGLMGIDTTALIATANACDESVPKLGDTTEKRYTCNAVLSSDADFEENLAKLLSASAGTMTPIGGAWIPDVAVWEEPELIFDADDFLDAFQIQNGLGAADSFNAIKGKYANPDKNYQPDDFPAIISSAYEIEDGGTGDGNQRVFKDVALDCTTSPSMAQRIARIDLRRGRQPLTFEANLKLRALQTTPGRNVAINFGSPLNWELKAFRVEKMQLIVGFSPSGDQSSGGQPGIIGATLTLRETAAEIYDWDASIDEQGVDIAPNTTLPDVFTALPASNLRATEAIYSTRDGGGAKAKLRLDWDASPDQFVVSGGSYRASYRLSGASEWTVLFNTTALFIEIFDIDPGLYEFKVEAINWAGISSEPITKIEQIVGLSAPPSAPTNFTVSAHDTVAYARWDVSPDLDVREGGFVVIKHSAEVSGATWDAALSIAEDFAGQTNIAVLPLLRGTYMIKFRDSSRLYSEVATFVCFQNSVHSFIALSGGSSIQDPAFAGTKTNVVLDGAALKLAPAGNFDDVVDVDSLLSWDWSEQEGVAPEGTYEYDAVMDLGSVKKCRLTNAVTALIENVFDDFDSRTGDCDDWPSWDGEVSGQEADSWLMVAATQDNPSGSPTWTDWQRLHSSSFEARGFKFQRKFASYDPSFTVAVSADSVVAEGV